MTILPSRTSTLVPPAPVGGAPDGERALALLEIHPLATRGGAGTEDDVAVDVQVAVSGTEVNLSEGQRPL